MRRTTTIFGATLALALLRCTSVPGLCDDPGSCKEGDGSDAGGLDGPIGEGGADVVAPPGCDLTKSPKDSANCIDDAVGVFVSPTGDDGATGKKAAPVKTIAKGVDLAASKGLPRVYVCEGTYDTAVEIKAPLSVFGGLTCAWSYSGAKPKLAPPNGAALRVTKVTGPVVVEDLEIVGSADAGKPGSSSIAALVIGSANVTFRSSALTAGDGAGGGAGGSASNYSTAAKDGVGTVSGGAAVTCTCLDGSTSSTGGKGGAIGAGGDPGSATPTVGGINSGLGGATCTPGTLGANGLANARGEGGSRAGSLTSDGWIAADDGTSGAKGNPGQGGGGGGGRTAFAGGGGGACGGCGGAGGKPGAAGGSSFALLSFQSTVAVEGGALKTSSGGIGGTGGNGQDGQGGGAPGVGACDGGPGGSGAAGSGGGGGAGGHSAPIAFVGTEPRVSGATITPGSKGGSGPGGQPGAGPGSVGNAGGSGAEGKAQNTLAL
ncbi:hypothetical protein BH11MYX4_BH11MYX4_29600 [soil metagenome]